MDLKFGLEEEQMRLTDRVPGKGVGMKNCFWPEHGMNHVDTCSD